MASVFGAPAIFDEANTLSSSADPAYFRLDPGSSPFAHHASDDLELIESEEVPVVRKQARVVEEVNVRVVEAKHTVVIHDSLQHTELAVENIANNAERNTGDLSPRPAS